MTICDYTITKKNDKKSKLLLKKKIRFEQNQQKIESTDFKNKQMVRIYVN